MGARRPSPPALSHQLGPYDTHRSDGTTPSLVGERLAATVSAPPRGSSVSGAPRGAAGAGHNDVARSAPLSAAEVGPLDIRRMFASADVHQRGRVSLSECIAVLRLSNIASDARQIAARFADAVAIGGRDDHHRSTAGMTTAHANSHLPHLLQQTVGEDQFQFLVDALLFATSTTDTAA
jgi:hypothetical protein